MRGWQIAVIVFTRTAGLRDNLTRPAMAMASVCVEAYPKVCDRCGPGHRPRGTCALEFVLPKNETAAPEKLHYAGQ